MSSGLNFFDPEFVMVLNLTSNHDPVYCLGGYHFYARKNRGCGNYDKDFKLEAWVLICFWLTNERISEWFCSSELLYSFFSATPESFAAKTAVFKLQGLNPRDVVFKFFPVWSCFFFQKNSHRNGGSHLSLTTLSSHTLIPHFCYFERITLTRWITNKVGVWANKLLCVLSQLGCSHTWPSQLLECV